MTQDKEIRRSTASSENPSTTDFPPMLEAEPKKTRGDAYYDQFYKSKACRYFKRGKCRRGSACVYAHGTGDLITAPDLTKTAMCDIVLKGGKCSHGEACKYAHDISELRVTYQCYKSTLCQGYMEGYCRMGSTCRWAHGESDILSNLAERSEKAETTPHTTISEGGSSPGSVESVNWDELLSLIAETEVLLAGDSGAAESSNGSLHKKLGSRVRLLKMAHVLIQTLEQKMDNIP